MSTDALRAVPGVHPGGLVPGFASLQRPEGAPVPCEMVCAEKEDGTKTSRLSSRLPVAVFLTGAK